MLNSLNLLFNLKQRTSFLREGALCLLQVYEKLAELCYSVYNDILRILFT